jgi:hypothetical protein
VSYLQAAKKPEPKAPMITIVGTPGAGKTSLGALFPGAIVLPTEDGTAVFENWDDDIQPVVLPRLPKSAKDEAGNISRSSRGVLMQIMDELINTDHPHKTLVIDSITSLDALFGHEIALRDGVNTVADASGGFHKGYAEVASWHADFIYKCEQLRAVKKMAIVFLAHVGVKKIRNRPDAAADYSVFSLDMDNQSLSVYVSQSDAVLYLEKEEFVTGQETNKKGQTTKFGRVTQTGVRKLITTGDGKVGYVNAKTRYNMPPEMEVTIGTNPIIEHIKFFNVEK